MSTVYSVICILLAIGTTMLFLGVVAVVLVCFATFVKDFTEDHAKQRRSNNGSE